MIASFLFGQSFTAGRVNCKTWPSVKDIAAWDSNDEPIETVARAFIPLTRCDYGSDAFNAGMQVSHVARRSVGGSAVS